MADNLWSSGGLGGFMGGGLEACRRRDSIGEQTVSRHAPVEGAQVKYWSPSRSQNARNSFGGGGSENVFAALGGGGGGGKMVTSASAIGAGWGVHQSAAQAQAASPVRGLRA